MTGPRILFLYSGLGVGGAERQLAVLAPALRERGLDPMVATLRLAGANFDALREAGIPTIHADMRSKADPRGALRAYRLWRTRPDVVFTQSADAHLIGHALAMRAGSAHVAAEHGGPGIPRRRRHTTATRLVAPRVARVVAVDESQRPDLRQLGYKDETIRVIPNGLPEPRVLRARDDVRRELGFGDDEVVALLVAALRPEKRADRFVAATVHAHATDGRIRGVVVGTGPTYPDIARQAAASQGVVQVLGERSDVPDLIAAADVVCLTSDAEGLPMSALEAMALAKPIVASDVGGLREAVSHGDTGWLVARDPVEVGRALVSLAGDPDRRRTMGAVARDRFRERYTVEKMVDGYVGLLSEILEGRT